MESLRPREWLRLGLTVCGIVLCVAAGYRLWSGPSNPSRYLGTVQVQKTQLTDLGLALVRLEPGPTRAGQLVDTSREDATVVFKSTQSEVTAVSALLINAAALTPDHTSKWQKLGYQVIAQPSGLADSRCSLLTRAGERFYQVSYYLNSESRLTDYEALNRQLLKDFAEGRRPSWVVRVDARLRGHCGPNSGIEHFTEGFNRDVQQFLRTQT